MKKVAILTDSNGGMTAQEARDLGVTVLPMPVYIDKKLYFEGVDLSQERFFELLPGRARCAPRSRRLPQSPICGTNC